MKSKIGVTSWSLQQLSFTKNYTIENLIDCVAEMGVDGIDICEEYIPCHPEPELDKIHTLRERVEKSGLEMGATWFCTEISGAIRASNERHVLEVYKKNILIASELGAKWTCIPMLLNLNGRTYEEAKKEYIHFFEQLLPFAEKYNMPLSHECAREKTNRMALDLARYFGSDYYSICPDLEAWRFDTPDLPLGAHCEDPDAGIPTPEPIELFKECIPYAPYIHFKLLSLNEEGEEPHFPIKDMMDAINKSHIEHYLCIEYEGWIPEIHPERDSETETKRCIEMVKRYQNK